MAEARVLSPAKISPQFSNDLLEISTIEPCSYILDISWKKRFAASLERGRYPSSSYVK